MKRFALGLMCAAIVGATAVAAAPSLQGLFFWRPRPVLRNVGLPSPSFHRIATFGNYLNNGVARLDEETVSEIVAATADAMTLVYTDSPLEEVGFIDISNPTNPLPSGKLKLKGEPTSVDVYGNAFALVAVNTSASLTNTSGYVAVVDLASRAIVREIDLGGQPDSLKISKDLRYAAVAIENERNEDICVNPGGAFDGQEVDEDDCAGAGGVLGGLPQTPYGNPAGYLAVLDLVSGNPTSWTTAQVPLAGYAHYGTEDPEPEFVDINDANQAVVTLQENNHLIIVDLKTKGVLGDFPAGTVDLRRIDTVDDDDVTGSGAIIALTDSLRSVPREPDAVAWVPGPGNRPQVATANEGDLFGGSRGFSLFNTTGAVVYDSGSEFEHIAVQHGHYPDARSDAKGSEPEAIAYGNYGGTDYLFVGSERGSFVAVYELRQGRPVFSQLLPAPLGPEGLLPIPSRGLLVASGEDDDPEFGVRSTVMIYQLSQKPEPYPQIVSDDNGPLPLPWSALSGMTAVPGQPDTLLAVWDSFYADSYIFRVDVSAKPAVITDRLKVTGGSRNFDPEGIAVAPDGTLWMASEGNASDSRPNQLIHVAADGAVIEEVGLPAEVIACRRASTARGTLGSGFEGVEVVPTGAGYMLYVAQQRGWDYTTAACEDLDDDAGGLNANGQPNNSRIWTYDPMAKTWDWIAWELAPKPANASWVGLSEITRTSSGELILIERDNLTGDFSELKTLVKIPMSATADGLVMSAEKSVHDILPVMKSTNGWITDKPEGVAVTGDGQTYLVTDNDGVDDWSGETSFFWLGPYYNLF